MLVIEAVFEDLERQAAGAGASSRAVLGAEHDLRDQHLDHPDRTRSPPPRGAPSACSGMHFFSPVERMPLLEVIPTGRTAPEAIVTAVQFGRRMGKTVIVVARPPGLLGQPDPVALPQRGGAAARGGHADRGASTAP